MDEYYVIKAESPLWENSKPRYYRTEKLGKHYWSFVSTEIMSNAKVFPDYMWAVRTEKRLSQDYPDIVLTVMPASKDVCETCGREYVDEMKNGETHGTKRTDDHHRMDSVRGRARVLFARFVHDPRRT